MRVKKVLLFAAALFLAAAFIAGYSCRAPGQAQFLNDRSREIIGADLLNAPGFITPAGLTGKGQVVAVADSGIDKGSLEDIHPDLASDPGKKPRIIMLKSWAGRPVADDPVGHGTHMVGAIAGSGKSSDGKFKGVAPGASVYFQGILDDKGRVAPPADVEKLFMPAYQAGARIHVNGWGTGTGSYSGTAVKTDAFMRKYPDFLAIFGAGNSGPGARSLTSEANSKNALVVGSSVSPRPALDFSSDETIDTAQFSSRGPAADGRIKPDLLAPGTSIISTRSSLVKGNLPGFPMYSRMQGSSMASAVAAGAAALMREYMQREMSIEQPTAASVKAALINGARIPEKGPSGEGFGVIDLAGSILALKEKTMALNEEIWGLPEGGAKTYRIKATNYSPFKATLAWTDPPGSPSAAKALVNNLDLVVTAPDGKKYTGNSFLGQGPDGINNVEQVYIKDPLPGEYLVEVRAPSVPVSAVKNTPVNMQDYSLVYGQPLSTGIIRDVGSGGVLRLHGGKEVNASGREVHYILNGNPSRNLSPEPGYRVYYGGGSIYVAGRQWSPESVMFRDGIGGRVWFEADGESREGGYYQSPEALKGITVNGKYTEDVSDLPLGVGLEATLDGLTQTLWRVVTGYQTKKGNVDRVVQGSNGDIGSIFLLKDRREYRLSPGASYIYNDIFEGTDPLETAFGSGRLDGLGRIMPGQQVTLVVSPVLGTVSSVLVNRSVVSGYVTEVVPDENKLEIGENPAYSVFSGASVQKDGKPSSLKNIEPGDYVVAAVLPGTREILGMAVYSSVVYGQVLFTSEIDQSIYINDNKNRFRVLRISRETEVRRWGLAADASTLTSGTWIRAILSPDGKEVLNMDVAELLEDEEEELSAAGLDGVKTAGGGTYSLSETATTVTKDGLPVTVEDLLPGEKATLVSLLAPAPHNRVLVAVKARTLEGVKKLQLSTTVDEEDGQLVLSGRTTGNRVYIWHENGIRETVPLTGGKRSFSVPLRFLEDEEVVKVVSVNRITGGVSGKTISRSQATRKGFDDIAGHWAEEAIVSAASAGIMAGYGDGTFRPDRPVTRSELATVLSIVADENTLDDTVFEEGGSPGEKITRAYFMEVLKESVQDDDNAPINDGFPFWDCERVTVEQREAIAWGYYRGIIKGRSLHYFEPEAHLTRAEVAVLIQNLRGPE